MVKSKRRPTPLPFRSIRRIPRCSTAWSIRKVLGWQVGLGWVGRESLGLALPSAFSSWPRMRHDHWHDALGMAAAGDEGDPANASVGRDWRWTVCGERSRHVCMVAALHSGIGWGVCSSTGAAAPLLRRNSRLHRSAAPLAISAKAILRRPHRDHDTPLRIHWIGRRCSGDAVRHLAASCVITAGWCLPGVRSSCDVRRCAAGARRSANWGHSLLP